MSNRQLLGLVGVALVAGALGYVARSARAGGVPSPNTMTYTGVLTDSTGKAVSGQQVQVSVWNDATSVQGANEVCGPYAAVTTSSDGSFAVSFDAACVKSVHTYNNLWVQIQVVGQPQPMPRSQLGAVPYALEAANAANGGVLVL
jgi:hypothetical protein